MTETILGFKNPPHIKEWYRIVDNKDYRKIVIAAPRGHAKSACLSENYPLQELVRDRNIRILIVSNTESQSQLHLRVIKGRIERDVRFQQYASKLKPRYPDKWTDREIIINRSNYDLKDASISTVGMGGSILTRRADLIICDDILSPGNAATDTQRRKVKNWFFDVLLPVLEPDGRMVIIGTLWNKGDLLTKLLNSPLYDFKKKYKAIIHDSNNLDLWEEWFSLRVGSSRKKANEFFEKNREKMYEGVEVLWKERMGYKKLFLLRKEDRIGFLKAYQNEIVSEEDAPIQEEWIRHYDEMPDESPHYQATGVDLAISEKTTADYTAMVSGKLFMENGAPKIYIIPNPINKRMAFHDTIEKARDVSLALGGNSLTDLWVEDVAYQKSAIQEMKRAGLPAEGVKVSTDKRARLQTIASYVQNGTVLFPRRGCEKLISQLVNFGAEDHDDLCDAFVHLVQSLMNKVAQEPQLFIF